MSNTQIQGTNDSSILSKCSMVERGYFKDDFVRFFTQKSVRRSPLINLGYYVRATVVETFLKSFLQNASSEVQILSLGAGFDTSFFRLQSILTASFKYYEVDFPEVVHNKIGCMVNNEKLSTLLGSYEISDGGFELRSARYCIVSQDLSDTAALDKALVSLGMDYNLPTLLFSECAITYMREEESTGLIGWAARSFPKGIFFTYEQIHPDDGFGMFMKKHFQNINSPICSVDAYKTLEDQNQRYLSAGWSECKSVSAMDGYWSAVANVSGQERDKAFRLEPFDEWEEWHLKCCHYAAIVAWNSPAFHLVPQFILGIKAPQLGINRRPAVHWTLDRDISVQRFGHCAVPFGDKGGFILVGGFGIRYSKTDGWHSRIGWMTLVEDSTSLNLLVDSDICWASMYPRCLQWHQKDPSFIVYGGRTSPLQAVNSRPKIVTFPDGCLEPVIKELCVESAQSPISRYRHSLEILDDRWLVVFGGRTQELEVLDDLWVLDLQLEPSEQQWKECVPNSDKPEGRFSHGSAVTTRETAGSSMYICGGLDSNFRVLSDIWRLDVDRGDDDYRWNRLHFSPTVLPRYGHTVHILDARLLIMIGGVNAICSQQPGVAILNLDTLICTEMEFRVEHPEMPIMLHNHWSLVSPDGKKILVIGGGGNCFSFGTHFNKRKWPALHMQAPSESIAGLREYLPEGGPTHQSDVPLVVRGHRLASLINFVLETKAAIPVVNRKSQSRIENMVESIKTMCRTISRFYKANKLLKTENEAYELFLMLHRPRLYYNPFSTADLMGAGAPSEEYGALIYLCKYFKTKWPTRELGMVSTSQSTTSSRVSRLSRALAAKEAVIRVPYNMRAQVLKAVLRDVKKCTQTAFKTWEREIRKAKILVEHDKIYLDMLAKQRAKISTIPSQQIVDLELLPQRLISFLKNNITMYQHLMCDLCLRTSEIKCRLRPLKKKLNHNRDLLETLTQGDIDLARIRRDKMKNLEARLEEDTAAIKIDAVKFGEEAFLLTRKVDKKVKLKESHLKELKNSDVLHGKFVKKIEFINKLMSEDIKSRDQKIVKTTNLSNIYICQLPHSCRQRSMQKTPHYIPRLTE